MGAPIQNQTPRAPEPADGTERKLLLRWLGFYRDALDTSCAGLTDDELTLPAAWPSPLSLHSLVRRLTDLERTFLVRALGGETEPEADTAPAFELLHPGEAQTALATWRAERARADALLTSGRLTDKSPGNGRSLRWNLMKVITEYARQAGHAELLRARIDGRISG